ncbi:hypothetical protein [Flammeovirga aprica]|uniref:Uncharacterized protein n=1 Tax=Flammeovirga aprica JL-4 TaxID=694437 RepID=A0A7X9X9X7_9BACT|nr:hypothetical protein [Flammeovirga aprica]NME69177.1 hypothetical protein [Flammeovirga aprica JL-4]
MSSNRLRITKKENYLKLTLRWFKPHHLVFLIFAIAWNSFIIAWFEFLKYGVRFDFMTIMFFILPLVHIAVGLGGFYYCLGLLLNRTIVKVENDKLMVKQFPLPWKKKFSVDVSEIEQLYVGRKKIIDKWDQERKNPLMLAKKNGDKIILLSGHAIVDINQVKHIERLLEDYMKIQDYAMPRELDSKSKPKKEDLKRERNEEINPTAISLSDLKDDFVFNYDLSSWVVTFTIQYDWVSGNTDKLLQVVSDGGEDQLLYLQKQNSIIKPWIESSVENFNFPTFDKSIVSKIPDTLEYDDEVYQLVKELEGKLFHKNQKAGHNVCQNLYLNGEKDKSIRIVWLSDENYSIYLGNKKEERHFDNILHRG